MQQYIYQQPDTPHHRMQQSKHWIHNAKVITNVYKYSIQLCTLYCCLWLENAGHICCLYWLRSHLNHCRCRTLWSFTAVRPMGLFNAPFRRLQLKLIYNCKSPKGEASARHRLCNLYFWTASSELAPDFKLRRCVVLYALVREQRCLCDHKTSAFWTETFIWGNDVSIIWRRKHHWLLQNQQCVKNAT